MLYLLQDYVFDVTSFLTGIQGELLLLQNAGVKDRAKVWRVAAATCVPADHLLRLFAPPHSAGVVPGAPLELYSKLRPAQIFASVHSDGGEDAADMLAGTTWTTAALRKQESMSRPDAPRRLMGQKTGLQRSTRRAEAVSSAQSLGGTSEKMQERFNPRVCAAIVGSCGEPCGW